MGGNTDVKVTRGYLRLYIILCVVPHFPQELWAEEFGSDQDSLPDSADIQTGEESDRDG